MTAPHPYNPAKPGGNRLSQQDITNTLRRLALQAGLPPEIAEQLTAHWLRRGAGTGLLADGAKLDHVQDLLGHASPVTTRDSYDANVHKLQTSPVTRLTALVGQHRTPEAASAVGTIHQIKITAVGVRPDVWRRLHVPTAWTLHRLHNVIQTAMGWQGQNAHQFGAEAETLPETQTLAEALADPGSTLDYLILPGAMGQQTLLLEAEKIHRPRSGVRYPRCTAGRRSIHADSGTLPLSVSPDMSALDDLNRQLGQGR